MLNWFGKERGDSGLTNSQFLFGGKENTGILTGAAQFGTSVLGGFLGLQQMRMGRRQMRQENAFARTNLANQATLTNRQLFQNTAQVYGNERANQELLKWGVSGTAGQSGYQGSAVGNNVQSTPKHDKDKGQM